MGSCAEIKYRLSWMQPEEDIQKYVKYSDLAIYSGSKAIEGPTVLWAVKESILNG